jgi:hypothetical protein
MEKGWDGGYRPPKVSSIGSGGGGGAVVVGGGAVVFVGGGGAVVVGVPGQPITTRLMANNIANGINNSFLFNYYLLQVKNIRFFPGSLFYLFITSSLKNEVVLRIRIISSKLLPSKPLMPFLAPSAR